AGAFAALGWVELEQSAVKVERFLGVEKSIQIRFFGEIADALVFLDLHRRLPENQGIPFGGEEQAQQELDGGGLAGPVRPEQAEDLAAKDLEIEGPERHLLLAAPKIAVYFRQLARLNDDFVVGHEWPPRERMERGPWCYYATGPGCVHENA